MPETGNLAPDDPASLRKISTTKSGEQSKPLFVVHRFPSIVPFSVQIKKTRMEINTQT
jgi:hypothetical protein